jgi:hypothetical protein
MVAFVDSFISFVILVGLMIWYGFISGWLILLLPAFAAIIERPKSGFSTPVQTWLKRDYRPAAMEKRALRCRFRLPLGEAMGLSVATA